MAKTNRFQVSDRAKKTGEHRREHMITVRFRRDDVSIAEELAEQAREERVSVNELVLQMIKHCLNDMKGDDDESRG